MSPKLSTDALTKQVLVRMPADMHAALKALAAANDRTMAQEVRRAVRLAITTKETP